MATAPDLDDLAVLDGNAVAGLLRELFCTDATTAAIECGGCAVVAEIGAIRVYGGGMGAIFRCARCDTAVFRLVRTPRGLFIDLRGAASLQLRAQLG